MLAPVKSGPPHDDLPEDDAARPPSTSTLGGDLRIRGEVTGRGDIHLHGRAWGDVKVEKLIVSETAELEGSVVANSVEIHGRVKGTIDAQSVRLLKTARVESDITYGELEMELGARFEGRCTRRQGP